MDLTCKTTEKSPSSLNSHSTIILGSPKSELGLYDVPVVLEPSSGTRITHTMFQHPKLIKSEYLGMETRNLYFVQMLWTCTLHIKD